jgi:hypothetical protein
MKPLQKGEGELADRATDLEKRRQHRAALERLGERELLAVHAGKIEFGGHRTSFQSRHL